MRGPGKDRSIPYDLVIFDFDGTLADSGEWFAGVINEVARRYRFRETTRAELESMRGLSAVEVMQRVGMARWKLPFVARHVRGLMSRDIAQIRLFPGIDGLLAHLRAADVRLALVSTNVWTNVERVLGPDKAALFETHACGASLFGKSAKFRDVLKRAGVAPERAIAIGDEVRDIEAATATGIASGAVTWGYATRAALVARQPTIVFDSVAAIRAELVGVAPEPCGVVRPV